MPRKKLIPGRSGERGDAGVEKEGPSPSSASLSQISPLPQHMQPAIDPRDPWPELDGRRIGAYAPCQRCGRGGWVYYGDTVLCLRHAKEAAFVAALGAAGVSADDIAVVVEIVRTSARWSWSRSYPAPAVNPYRPRRTRDE